MAVADYFLAPLGLAALASAIPLLLLYLLQPDPARVEIPTVRFLLAERQEGSRSTVIETLRRNLLLVLQLLVLVFVSLALAAPYVSIAAPAGTGEVVIVLDASASMALVVAAKARALLEGRAHVSRDDIEAMAPPVLRHRLILSFGAEREGKTPDDVVGELLG